LFGSTIRPVGGPTAKAKPKRRRAALAVLGMLALWLLAPAAADARLLTAANGNLAAFDGGVSQVSGTLTAVDGTYGADSQIFQASYTGTSGGAASGSFNVNWKRGQTVAFGAAFELPSGFHTAVTGEQSLLRWGGAPESGGRIERDAVVIDYSDDTASLIAETVSGGVSTERTLAGPFSVPIGAWFTLQVRQLLGSGSAAYSDVYVDGEVVATSRAPTFAGQRGRRVSYGIVDLTAGAEQGPVSLEFDQATAANYTGYVNPFGGDTYYTERTDMGVDFCLTPGEPIRAIGDATVVGVMRNWFVGQPYIWYQLLDGPEAGRYVYVAEQIHRLARVGTQLTAGEPVAYFKRRGTCIEAGWSAADGATWAQATTGYHEGQVTKAGVSFARFLISLGVQGPFELHPTPPPKRKHTHRKKR